MTDAPNLRWCSDGFEFKCWSRERVFVSFALDCWDRKVLAHHVSTCPHSGQDIRDLMVNAIEDRFGTGIRRTPEDIQWLSENGPVYTAKETIDFAETLGLISCFTPPYSLQSNGMAEAFVNGFKRDYAYVSELRTAAKVLSETDAWFYDYNAIRTPFGLEFHHQTNTQNKQLRWYGF